jgi:indolepyruvate ferredoxin oxidoreductase beta subunit
MEPLESLRYVSWLAPSGALVSAAEPLVNIGNYPEIKDVIAAIKQFPVWRLLEAAEIAKAAGFARAVNTVMVGAASPFLPVKAETLESTIAAMFASKPAEIIAANTKAFQLGRAAASIG